MGKQDHSFPFTGTVGKLSFYKSKIHGYLIRAKTGVSKERIENDPKYAIIRKSMAEFLLANKAVKLLRAAFRGSLLNIADALMTARMVRQMMKVLQADSTHELGLRTVVDGQPALLKGFEFNENGILSKSLVEPFISTIDRATGILSASIGSFDPKEKIVAPKGSTHYRIISAAAALDFAGENFVATTQNSNILPLDKGPAAPVFLENSVPANSSHTLMLLLGIEFYKEVNDGMNKLNNGAFNGLAIVEVDHV